MSSSQEHRPVIDIVAVSYRNSSTVGTLIRSLEGQSDRRWRLHLVDNAVDDDAEHERLRLLVEPCTRATLWRAPSNLGYFGAVEWLLGQADLAAGWLCVANADIEFAQPDFVTTLDELPSVRDVIAPAVQTVPSGRNMNPYLVSRPSAAWGRQRAFLFSLGVVSQLRVYAASRRVAAPPRTPVPAGAIYAPHGSCLLISRTAIRDHGWPTHPTFLFGEEFTIAEYARRHGLVVRYEPELEVEHREHQATGQWRTRQMIGYQREAARYISRLLAT